MAVLKRSLRRKNATGNYDTIRLESDSSIVYRPSGRTVEQDLAAYLPSTQSSDVVPKTLNHGKIVTGTSRIFVGVLDSIVELSIVPPEPEVPELPNLGQTIDLFGYTWLACHNDGTKKYLITKDIIKNVKWNVTNTTSGRYASSNIKRECTNFANTLGVNSLDYVVNTGVGKVFIPTKEQMTGESGGFSYFDRNSKRIAKLNGSAALYWTATPYDSSRVWYVIPGGDINGGGYYASDSLGFRPCICIDTTLYNS